MMVSNSIIFKKYIGRKKYVIKRLLRIDNDQQCDCRQGSQPYPVMLPAPVWLLACRGGRSNTVHNYMTSLVVIEFQTNVSVQADFSKV
jgi:hypothetical protein